MAHPITLSVVSIGMEEASIVRWWKSVGEAVSEGETLFEIETDKSVLEVCSPHIGTLLAIEVSSGNARVGQIVGWVGDSGEVVRSDEARYHSHQFTSSSGEILPLSPAQSVTASSELLATPAARRYAKELKIDLTQVQGTGPGGRITQEDVQRASSRMQ